MYARNNASWFLVLIVRSTLTFHVKSMSEIVKYVKRQIPYLLCSTTEQIGIHKGGGVLA
jgi:hypothetical protein